MSYSLGLLIPFVAAALASGLAAQETQNAPQLTARELFYHVQPAAAHSGGAKKAGGKTSPAKPPDKVISGQVKPPDRPAVIRPGGAVVTQADATALGLRYSIVRRSGTEAVEVPVDTVFHAKEGIQLRVETNGPGYLYVVNKGSSGTWKPMFPAPEIAGGDNHVEGFVPVTLPRADKQMTFDERTGTENLFIVFSRQPVPDFEELIYSLSQKPGAPARTPPAEKPAPAQQPKVVVARADIDDAIVGRVRDTVYARDLVIESVTPATPPDTSAKKKETAVYVVRPASTAESRVVADIPLRHQ